MGNSTNDLHVVLGASGGAGYAIAQALVSSGCTVRAVNHAGDAAIDGAVPLGADLETPEGCRTAVAGASVVYMAAQPPYTDWSGRFPTMLRGVIDATAAVGAKLVMVDNVYGYGAVTGPMTESTPERATDAKGRTRREMTEMLLQAMRDGLPITIGRASDYFGPHGDNSTITALTVAPAVTDGKARWLIDLDQPHSLAYLPDIGRAYAILGSSPEADGKVWHLPHAPAVTGRKFIAMIDAVTARPVRTSVVSKGMLWMAAPFHRMSREGLGIAHQWSAPFVVDDSSFRAQFVFEPTPLEHAVADTVAWYREH